MTPNGVGYLVVGLYGRGTKTIHTLILEAFVGPRPPGMECRHLNGDRTDNRLENLKWGTYSEQAGDKRRHGTLRYGEGHWNAKLTEDDVRAILRLRETGVSIKELAALFRVGEGTIIAVIYGDNWKHLALDPVKIGGPFGSGKNNAKLTESDVVEIRHRHKLGDGQRTLAKRYGVSRNAVRNVIVGNTWTHVPMEA